MPTTAGLSLVGFMTDPQQVLLHLKMHCEPEPTTKTDNELLADWATARGVLGPPIEDAGRPDIKNLPSDAYAHVDELLKQNWFLEGYSGWSNGASLKLVEIDKLLAFQFSIDVDRTDHHCKGVSKPPTLDEMLSICLPIKPPAEDLKISQIPPPNWAGVMPRAAVITARGLNLRMGLQGVFNDAANTPNSVGFFFGFGSPAVQVVQLNGRCYLHNGFHRALGLRLRGATHIPCVFRDVAHHMELGIQPGGTFDAQLLDGPNPPTLAHFTNGRAHPVKIREMRTVLHVTWAAHHLVD